MHHCTNLQCRYTCVCKRITPAVADCFWWGGVHQRWKKRILLDCILIVLWTTSPPLPDACLCILKNFQFDDASSAVVVITFQPHASSRLIHSRTSGNITSPEVLAQGNWRHGNSSLLKIPWTIKTNMWFTTGGVGNSYKSVVCAVSNQKGSLFILPTLTKPK